MANTVTLSNGKVITKYIFKADKTLLSLLPGGKYYGGAIPVLATAVMEFDSDTTTEFYGRGIYMEVVRFTSFGG